SSPSRSVIGDVHREILHIQAILNDLLSYARPRPPDFHPANLNTTIEQAALMARQQVLTKPIEVSFEPNPSLPLIEHDPALIQQVVLNLALNGIQAMSGLAFGKNRDSSLYWFPIRGGEYRRRLCRESSNRSSRPALRALD